MTQSEDKLGIVSDASYLDQDECMGTYGYVAYLGGPVSWACKTTTNQAKSTCEAEYIAMSAATSEVIYLQNLLGEMGFPQGTTKMFVDNTAALAIAQDPKQHQKTKAIRLRYHHVRHEVANRTIKPTYQKTTELSADLMTKSLPRDQHEYLREKVLGYKDYLDGNRQMNRGTRLTSLSPQKYDNDCTRTGTSGQRHPCDVEHLSKRVRFGEFVGGGSRVNTKGECQV